MLTLDRKTKQPLTQGRQPLNNVDTDLIGTLKMYVNVNNVYKDSYLTKSVFRKIFGN